MLEKDEKGSLCHLAHVQSKQIMYGTRGPPREQNMQVSIIRKSTRNTASPHGIVLTSDVKVSPTAYSEQHCVIYQCESDNVYEIELRDLGLFGDVFVLFP